MSEMILRSQFGDANCYAMRHTMRRDGMEMSRSLSRFVEGKVHERHCYHWYLSPKMCSQCIGVLGPGQARIDSTLRSACSTYRSCTKHSRQQASRHRPRQLQPQTAIPADWRYNCAPPALHAEGPASHPSRLQTPNLIAASACPSSV